MKSFKAWWEQVRDQYRSPEHQTTKDDVAVLLENFKNYVNPKGDEDAWFTLSEINQQFAWIDVPDSVLQGWLLELVEEGKVEADTHPDGKVWRWLS